MNQTWLIFNPRSKGCGPELVAEIEQLFHDAGQPIGRKLEVGVDGLPDGEMARAAGISSIILMSGDGTINTVARRLSGWDGTLIVLPGGTMNLLAQALHGDAPVADVARAALAGSGASARVPVIRCGDETAFAGIIVGPSSAWADVREDLRNLDVRAIAPDAVQAVQATFNEPGVRVAGNGTTYPAIYIEPRDQGLGAFGVQAESGRDLLAHGWAWLRGDFREGPSQDLDVGARVTLASDADSFDMLVDGERAQAPNPATFSAGLSDVHFFSMLGGARWS
jgi:hypothetical protein